VWSNFIGSWVNLLHTPSLTGSFVGTTAIDVSISAGVLLLLPLLFTLIFGRVKGTGEEKKSHRDPEIEERIRALRPVGYHIKDKLEQMGAKNLQLYFDKETGTIDIIRPRRNKKRRDISEQPKPPYGLPVIIGCLDIMVNPKELST